ATPDRTAKSQPPGSLPGGCTLPTSGSTRPARSAGRRPLTQVAGVQSEHVRDDAVAELLRRLVPEGPPDPALDARARGEVEPDALEVEGAAIQAGRVVVHLFALPPELTAGRKRGRDAPSVARRSAAAGRNHIPRANVATIIRLTRNAEKVLTFCDNDRSERGR